MPRVQLLGLLLATAALASAGCVNTDPAVFVAPTIDAPSLTVGAPSVLVMGITGGSFSLDLHLGARAAGPSTVTLGQFSIQNATMTDTFTPVEVKASSGFANGTTVVQPDSDVVTTFAIQMTQLSSSTVTAICGAGGIVIAGVFTDSLKGTSEPVNSDIFQPTGCK